VPFGREEPAGVSSGTLSFTFGFAEYFTA